MRETRVFDGAQVERRAEGEPRRIVGYAAVFGVPADIGGIFREVIQPGAFASVLGRDDVRALINHDENYVLGRTAANTLRLAEDERGLRVEIDLPDTQAARDLVVSMERGDVTQMSFAFSMRGGRQRWDETGDDMPLRTIEQIGELYDVSVVTYPAYPETEAAVRSLEQHRDKVRKHRNFRAAALRVRLKANLDRRVRRA